MAATSERPAWLDRLEVLTGQWEMEATFEAGYFSPDSPAMTGRGAQTTFAPATSICDS